MEKTQNGFTLIELLVVVAIVGMLAGIVLISLQSAREKSRDSKRLSDMTQVNTYLELYFSKFRGYPGDEDNNGIPDDLAPQVISFVPRAPTPADSLACQNNFNPCGGPGQPACVPANNYYYAPAGSSFVLDGKTLWSDYNYYFCLGSGSGIFGPGMHVLNPKGVQ